MFKILSVFFISGAMLMSGVSPALSDHEGPERIVDGKYRVALTIVENNDESTSIKFFFRNPQTGKKVSDISGYVSIYDEPKEELILNKELIAVENGLGELAHTFPKGGLFYITLEFKENSKEEVYGPIEWSVWLPGVDGKRTGYPLGLSELAGFGLLGLAIIVGVWSFIHNRNVKKQSNMVQ